MSTAARAATVALLVSAFSYAQFATAQTDSVAQSDSGDGDSLNEVIVNAVRIPPLTVPDIAGNSTQVSIADVEQGRVSDIADALKFVPGLIAQTQSGEEATRFSLRGSSLIRGAGSWGTGLIQLLDGLPMTSPAGSPYEYYDALPLQQVQVYPGANAFQYGPTELGGAINYIPRTGYDSSPLLLRAETGEYGYVRAEASTGGKDGPLDYYVNADTFHFGGFRNRNGSYSNRVTADTGVQVAPNLKTRFYGIFAQQDTQNVSSLSWSQIKADPELNTTTAGNRHDTHSVLLANKTDYDIDDASNLELGTVYKYYPLESPQGGSNPGLWLTSDISVQLRYSREDTLLGDRHNSLKLAFLYSDLLPGASNTGYNSKYVVAQHDLFSGYDHTALLSDELEVVKKLYVTAGIARIWQERGSDIVYPVNNNLVEHYSNNAPRVGLRYQLIPSLDLYSNYSRSLEAPIPLYLPQSVNNVYNHNNPLKAQSADTLEVGTEGGNARLQWSLAAYQSWLNNELLTVQVTPATPTTPAVTVTSNATPTIHRGIEQAADAILWKQDDTSSLRFREAITIEDFYYRHDPVWGGNELPALPTKFLQATIEYTGFHGFYVGVDTESVPQRYAADFANTLWARPYTIFNARIGVRPPFFGASSKLQIFAEIDNLTNRHYISATAATFNAKAVDSAVYTPGVGRDISGGVQYEF
jgi:iron complex outermembrane receptor protein